MGCDIHLFVELGGKEGWRAFSDGELLLPRDYALFSALAGVRAEVGATPLIAPRGIPRDVSAEVATRYFLPVLDDEDAGRWGIGEHAIPTHAAALVASGSSRWIADGTTPPLLPATGGYISHPDWHSASWLTAEELQQCLEHAGYCVETASDELQLVCRTLELAAQKNLSPRVVFWFDN